MGSDASTVLVTVLFLAGTVLAAAPSLAWHTDTQVVHEDELDGSGAYAASVEMQEAGQLGLGLVGFAEEASAPATGGTVIWNDDGSVALMIALTLHRSPDRLVVQPTPANPAPSDQTDDGAAWETHVRGDTSLLADADVSFEAIPESETAGTSSDEPSPVLAVGLTMFELDPGTYHVGAWLAEADRTTVQVETDASVGEISTEAGTGHVAGDHDLEDGSPNVQYQNSEIDPSLLVDGLETRLGVKAIHDASIEVDAEEGLYGFWGLTDRKYTCPGVTSACLSTSMLEFQCEQATEYDCGAASVSWEGPSDRGSPSEPHALHGGGAGTHVFTVDHKVDAYAMRYHDSDTRSTVAVDQHYSYLTVGDIAFPG